MEVYQFGEQNDSSPDCCVVRQDLLSYCKQDGKGEINIYLEKNVEDLLFGFVVLNIQEEDFNNLDTSNLYPNIFSFKFKNGPPYGQAGDLIKLQFEFKKNRRGDLLIGVRYSLKTHAFSRRSETFGWSERKVSFSPRILRFAMKAPQGSLFVLSNNDVERLLLKPALLESCRIKYVCNYCLSHFPRMCAPPCGHTVCVTCEKQLPKSEIRNGKRHIKCPVSCNDDLHTLHHLRFRNGPCPLEENSEKPANCKAIALIPCGCVLSHQPTKELTICPFELCQQKVYNFMKLYFEEEA